MYSMIVLDVLVLDVLDVLDELDVLPDEPAGMKRYRRHNKKYEFNPLDKSNREKQ